MFSKVFLELKDIKLVSIFIILLSISLAPFLDNITKMNWLLVGSMVVASSLYLKYSVSSLVERKFWIILIIFFIISFIFNPSSFRLATFIYSAAFISFFILYTRVFSSNTPKLEQFSLLLYYLLLAFWIVLLLQQFCVITGLPIINSSGYSPLEKWKLNSLTSEPSHSARIIPLIMYVYMSLREHIDGKLTFMQSIKKYRIAWFAFLYCCITMGSATAYFFMLMVFSKYFEKKRLLSTLVAVVLVSLVALFFLRKTSSFSRFVNVVVATATLDENRIFSADGSGAYRIVPTIQGAKAIGLFTYEDWFGHGTDADINDIKPLPGTTAGCAGAFTMWYNYGVIFQLLFWIVTFSICFKRDDYVSIIVWFLCVWSYGGINNQVIWLTIVLMYSYKRLVEKENDIIYLVYEEDNNNNYCNI